MTGPPPSLTEPGLVPVWDAVRSRLESAGTANRGRVRLPPLAPEARRILAALLDRPPAAMLDLAALERSLVALGVGDDLPGALAALGFPPSGEPAARRAARAERASAAGAARSAAALWPEPWAGAWADEVVRAGLLRGLDAEGSVALVADVRRVLDGLGTEGGGARSRTDLAAAVLGSSHALDRGTAVEAATTRALVHLSGDELAVDAWERAGIHTDLVSAAALTWRLPLSAESGLAPLVRAASEVGVPVHLTRLALLAHPVGVPWGADVLVCENPRVVEAAAQRGVAVAVVTTNGNPSSTVRLLLEQLLASGAQLRYHGDFDAPGLAICGRLHRLGLEPWHMDTDHYLAAVQEAAAAGVSLPVDERRVGPTPWDPTLRTALTEHRRIVHEERLLDQLLV